MNSRTTAKIAGLVRERVRSVFVGSDETIDRAVLALFSGLHLLVEDVPGVGKTTLARALATATGMDFGRIQCTPDLLPGDVTGMNIWDVEAQVFRFRQGAVMHQFILADELNRASTRTQAALLEAMQEGGVTVDDETHKLPQPFFLFATENPSTFAGTFGLPEAQLDRFGIKLTLGYPEPDLEREILKNGLVSAASTDLEAVCAPADIREARREVSEVYVDERIADFIIDLLSRTRQSSLLRLGGSPRAGVHLQQAARARAAISGRDFVEPEDVREMMVPVLAHRVQPSAEARMEQLTPDAIVSRIAQSVRLPTGYAARSVEA